MGTSIFDKKDILIHRKHSKLTFEEFVQSIPLDFKGYLLETIDTDTVGNSNSHPRWGQIFEYEKGEINWKRSGHI